MLVAPCHRFRACGVHCEQRGAARWAQCDRLWPLRQVSPADQVSERLLTDCWPWQQVFRGIEAPGRAIQCVRGRSMQVGVHIVQVVEGKMLILCSRSGAHSAGCRRNWVAIAAVCCRLPKADHWMSRRVRGRGSNRWVGLCCADVGSGAGWCMRVA